MDFITMLSSTMPNGFWENIIGWFQGFMGSFGWTIVVFTICLKLVLLPVDFWQKKTTRTNSQKQAVLQPEIDKIKKKYAGNDQMINQKTMELYKKNNYNVVGTCFGLLINLVITMVVFFTLFSALNNISYHKIKEEYATLETTYIETQASYFNDNEFMDNLIAQGIIENEQKWIDEFNNFDDNNKEVFNNDVNLYIENESHKYAWNFVEGLSQEAVSQKYGEIKESWLWINNIFRPDTGASIFPKTAEEYMSLSSFNLNEKEEVVTVLPQDVPQENYETVENGYKLKYYYYSNIQKTYAFTATDAEIMFNADYKSVTGKLVEDYSGFNGYFILIILAGLITTGSQFLANLGMKAKNKKGEEVKVKGKTNIAMLVILPALMIYFTIQYSSAFALYIIMNSLISAVSGYLLNLLMNKLDERKENKTKPVVVEYARKK